jgi:hypothetical protein
MIVSLLLENILKIVEFEPLCLQLSNDSKQDGEVAQVAGYLPIKHDSLNSVPSTAKKKKKKKSLQGGGKD